MDFIQNDNGTLIPEQIQESDVNGLTAEINETNSDITSLSSQCTEIGTPITITYVSKAVFGGGSNNDRLSTTSIYIYSSNTSAAGTDLTYSTDILAAAGNSTLGVFGGGSNNGRLSTTSIYTYSSNTTAAGTDLTHITDALAAAGNSTLGVFGGGYSNGYLSTTCIYTYSTNTTAAGTDLTHSSGGLATAGNSTLGVFGEGVSNSGNLSTTSIYTYSTNTTAAGTDLTHSAEALAAAGNSTLGVFGGGNNSGPLSTTSIYTYSSNTTAAGTDLTYSTYYLAATGNSTLGVFGGGAGPVSTTSIYTYSTNTTAAGTDLTHSTGALAAVSNNNIGVNSSFQTVFEDLTYLNNQITSINNSLSAMSTETNSDITSLSSQIFTLSSNVNSLSDSELTSADLLSGQTSPFFNNIVASGKLDVFEINASDKVYKKGIIIPYYQTPGSGSDTASIETIIFTASQFPELEWFIIFNPDSGPGTAVNVLYTQAIDICKAYGIKVLGYVDTHRGSLTVTEINLQVNQWVEFYGNIDGIFFDVFPDTYTEALATTYEQIYYYAKYIQKLGYVFVNPGIAPPTQYFTGPKMWDCLNIWENSSYPLSVSQLYGNNQSFYENQSQRYSGIVNNQSSYDSEQAQILNQYCSLVYVTLSETYQVLSTYLSELAISLTYIGSDVSQLCSDVEDLSTSIEESSSSSISSLYAEIGTPITSTFVSKGVFGGGDTTSASVTHTCIYVYSSNTTSVGTSLTFSDGGISAAGNSTLGVFGGGTNSNQTTSKYIYASDITAAGAKLTYGGGYMGATGNYTQGVFGGGSAHTSSTSIYTYSSNLVAGGANLTHICQDLAAVGTSTLGVFGGGYGSAVLSTTSIYTYSTNTTSAGTNLTYRPRWLAAAGNSTQGVFGGGSSGNGTTSLYLYASNQTAAGTNLTYGMGSLAATGSSSIGVFGGGSYKVSTTSIYSYTDNTVVSGANLTYSPYGLAACSDDNVGVTNSLILNPLVGQTVFEDLTYLNNQITSIDNSLLAMSTEINEDNYTLSSQVEILSSDIQSLSATQEFIPQNYSGSNLTTTGSINAGSTTLTLSAAIDFLDGQGITISRAGASGVDLTAVQILSGGGTTTLTIDVAASTTVSSTVVYHDDTVSIQNAINAAGPVMGKVRLPTGTPQVSKTLSLPSGITLVGQSMFGTQIQSYLNSGTDATFPGFILSGTDCAGNKLSNFSIRGPGISGVSGSGIEFTLKNNNDITGLDLSNLFIFNFPGTGIFINTPVMSKFSNIWIQTFAGNGIQLYNGTSCVLSSCYTLTGVGSGFYLDSMTYCSLDGCAGEGCGIDYDFFNSNNIALNGCGSEVAQYRNSLGTGIHYQLTNSTGIVINGGYARDFAVANTTSGNNQYINLSNNSQATFLGFRGISATNDPTNTYYIDNTSRVRFVDCQFDGLNNTVNTVEAGGSIVIESSLSSLLRGTTAGTVTSSMPQQGLFKSFKAYLNGYENDSTTSQSIAFPVPFINPPVILQNTTGLSLTATTSGLTITAPNNTDVYSGFIYIDGS